MHLIWRWCSPFSYKKKSSVQIRSCFSNYAEKGTSKYSLALVFLKPRWAMGRSLIWACVCGCVYYMCMCVRERFSLHHYSFTQAHYSMTREMWCVHGCMYTCARACVYIVYVCSRWLRTPVRFSYPLKSIACFFQTSLTVGLIYTLKAREPHVQ